MQTRDSGIKSIRKGEELFTNTAKNSVGRLDRGKTKTQFLEQRVKEMEDRFQAVGYALGFGDGKEQSKKANGGKRKAEVKVTIFFVEYCYYFYYFLAISLCSYHFSRKTLPS